MTQKSVNSLAVPVKIAHVVFRTRRFDEMLNWYQRVFDARVQHKNPAVAFLTFDDEHHRFAFVNLAVVSPDSSEPSDGIASGVDHVAFTFAGLDELMETYFRLDEAGIKPYWSIHHGMTISFYYNDPEGNRIEFQAERFATTTEGNAYFHSDAFSQNPIGVNFDAEEFGRRFRSGESPESLFEMPEGPPAMIPPAHGI